MKNVVLHTDSRTVHGWLTQLLNNIRRVKVSGLHTTLVQRRLQIIDDLITVSGITVDVEWVRSEDNMSDQLTRVPTWFRVSDSPKKPQPDVAAAGVTVRALPPLAMGDIATAQVADEEISSFKAQLLSGEPIPNSSYSRVRTQLVIEDDVLFRSVKSPLNDVELVPALPQSLTADALAVAHTVSGHAGWESMWRLLRSQC